LSLCWCCCCATACSSSTAVSAAFSSTKVRQYVACMQSEIGQSDGGRGMRVQQGLVHYQPTPAHGS
jgi:hypothetical protein